MIIADFKVTGLFFDAKAVTSKLNAAKKRVLSRSGSIVRGVARRSIRYRKKKTSAPGQIPFTHVKSGQFGLRTIFFHYDPHRDAVIVGPIGGKSSVPHALEFGGITSGWAGRGSRRKRRRRFIAARPFMAPALKHFEKSYPQMWRDAIK